MTQAKYQDSMIANYIAMDPARSSLKQVSQRVLRGGGGVGGSGTGSTVITSTAMGRGGSGADSITYNLVGTFASVGSAFKDLSWEFEKVGDAVNGITEAAESPVLVEVTDHNLGIEPGDMIILRSKASDVAHVRTFKRVVMNESEDDIGIEVEDDPTIWWLSVHSLTV